MITREDFELLSLFHFSEDYYSLKIGGFGEGAEAFIEHKLEIRDDGLFYVNKDCGTCFQAAKMDMCEKCGEVTLHEIDKETGETTCVLCNTEKPKVEVTDKIFEEALALINVDPQDVVSKYETYHTFMFNKKAIKMHVTLKDGEIILLNIFIHKDGTLFDVQTQKDFVEEEKMF